MVARPERHAPPAPSGAPLSLREEVLLGLRGRPKRLPCKLFYDDLGSRLFESITRLEEYYPTRTETGILRERGRELRERVGAGALVMEFGCGSGIKTRLLLDALQRPAAYVPVDIWREGLAQVTRELRASHPRLAVRPVHADYHGQVELPRRVLEKAEDGRRVVFFPGSTIGNFDVAEREGFLRRVRALVAPQGLLIVGVDLKKDPAVLHAAYNDRQGVTAAFNRNALAHVNRALDADFDLKGFDHYAFYEPLKGRVEMHLLSRREQTVHVAGERVRLRRGETIHTENSHKFAPDEFERIAKRAGFAVEALFTDAREWFGVFLLAPRAGGAPAEGRTAAARGAWGRVPEARRPA